MGGTGAHAHAGQVPDHALERIDVAIWDDAAARVQVLPMA
jgi:hypothetical protein